jgi:hypothetical protein
LTTGPQEDAFGLTYDGTYFWTTDHPGSSSTPAVALQFNLLGSLISQFNLPEHYMSGIAYDNGNFWVARYYADPAQIYKVNGSGTILKQFQAPDNQPWDLCLENGYLWMADYWGDALYKIDTATGAMLESHPSEGVDPAGVVWDGQYLWYCDEGSGYSYDALYKVDLSGVGTPDINLPTPVYGFGLVTVGQLVTWDAPIENVGTADLIVSNISFTGTGAADMSLGESLPVTIPAGDQTTIPINWLPASFYTLNATATFVSNDPVTPSVNATVLGQSVNPGPDINVAENAHSYGVVRAGANTRWFIEVQNQGSQPLIVDKVTSDDEQHFIIDKNLSLPLAVGVLDTAYIGIWFRPEMSVTYGTTIAITSNDPDEGDYPVAVDGSGIQMDYPIGYELWSYQISGNVYDNSAKAIAWIPDINDDGVADVIVCSEDYFVRCLNGNSHGTADVLWEHEIYGGSVYSQGALAIIEDVNADGYADVIVGSAWAGRLIRAISGLTGEAIWTHDTHEYGDGGWVYQVDCSYDYNGDGVTDVLAATGNDADYTGPVRVYCLDGLTGLSIWERPLGGPVFSVRGVSDFTGDALPDVVAGASTLDETTGKAYGIDGASGSTKWTFTTSGSSVWGVAQIDDANGDGTRDVMIGDFSFGSGVVYGLNAKTGGQLYADPGYGSVVRLEEVGDLSGDGHPDVVPAHAGTVVTAVNGQTGDAVWSHPVADKPWCLDACSDISGDGLTDLMVGTLYTNNYAYFLNGTDGSELHSIPLGSPVDAIGAIPDIVGDASTEMVVGGRDGLLFCFSGGLDAFTFLCGDADGSGGDPAVDIDDVVYLINYIFASGPPPDPIEAGDVNCNGGDVPVDIDDVVYLINYVFAGGPEPCADCK